MSLSGSIASIALALMLISAASTAAEASTSAATDEAARTLIVQPAVSPPAHPSTLAQNPAAQCINGYRLTHVVKSQGRVTGGVILKCRS